MVPQNGSPGHCCRNACNDGFRDRTSSRRPCRPLDEWLPEPIITGGHDDPAQRAETTDSLSMAMLVLLERLSPEQRAVLLLHDVFDYGYPEITTIVGKSEDNVRQLASRGRYAGATVSRAC